jgi:hypothetical protein
LDYKVLLTNFELRVLHKKTQTFYDYAKQKTP